MFSRSSSNLYSLVEIQMKANAFDFGSRIISVHELELRKSGDTKGGFNPLTTHLIFRAKHDKQVSKTIIIILNANRLGTIFVCISPPIQQITNHFRYS